MLQRNGDGELVPEVTQSRYPEHTGGVAPMDIQQVIMRSGLRVFHGRLTEEYLPELTTLATSSSYLHGDDG